MSKIRKIIEETQTKKIKNEKKKKAGETEAIAKRWEINDFVERLS